MSFFSKSKPFLFIGAALSVAGCASNPRDISPTYVSTVGYKNMSCADLQTEAETVSSRAAQAFATQEKNVGNDAAMTTVAIVVFWPALFFNKGDGAAAAEVGRLKGEMQAIEDASQANNCGIVFEQLEPSQPA